jgi:lysophospholipase L1-like esterase
MPPEAFQSHPEEMKKLLDKPVIRTLLQDLNEAVGGVDEAQLIAELAVQLEGVKEIVMQDAQEARAELLQSIQRGEVTNQTNGVDTLARIIQEEIIEAKMEAEDLKTLSMEELIALEEEQPGILLFAFTTWGDRHAHVAIEDFKLYQSPQQGVELEIDFRGNENAYHHLGADDILPPEVRRITVIPGDGGAVRTSTRRVGLKGGDKSGFFDDRGYIPIYTGDIVVVGGAEEYFEAAGVDPKELGLDRTIRETYFDEDTGEWDYDAYNEDHRAEDDTFLIDVWETSTGLSYEGDVFDPELAKRLRLKSPVESGDIHDVIDAHPDWFAAAEAAAVVYGEQFDMEIDPAVIYAIIKHESGFQAQIPNGQGSAALGLGQFMPGTWESTDYQGGSGFLAENKALVERLLGHRLPKDSDERSALRTNPILSIYATTWYAAQNAEVLNLDGVTQDTAYYVYSAHHDGAGGARNLLAYRKGNRDVGLADFQKSPTPEDYWNFIDNYSAGVAATARQYRSQLDSGNPSDTVGSVETGEAAIRASEVALIGDSITEGYKGHLTIGGQSIPEGRIAAKVGKPLYNMHADLERDIQAGNLGGVRAVVLMGGANDLADTGPTGTVAAVTGHLSKMIQLLHAYNPDIKITLVTHHPVLDVKPSYTWNGQTYPGYYPGRKEEVNRRILEINEWIRNQGETLDHVRVVDLYTLVEDPHRAGHVKPEYLNGDGLHLSPKGSQLLASQVGQTVESAFRTP